MLLLDNTQEYSTHEGPSGLSFGEILNTAVSVKSSNDTTLMLTASSINVQCSTMINYGPMYLSNDIATQFQFAKFFLFSFCSFFSY